jgi:hypothetical protein
LLPQEHFSVTPATVKQKFVNKPRRQADGKVKTVALMSL